jgi:hypothetical protein
MGGMATAGRTRSSEEGRAMSDNLPEKANADRALVAEIAMDVGKEAVSHLRVMYPAAFEALGKSGQLSLRNCIHNQIMAALETTDADEIKERLEHRRKARRAQHKFWDAIRTPTT